MSAEVVTIIRNVRLSNGPAKFVLWLLADLANEAHQCAPSVASLSETTQFARRTVQNALARLESSGIVSIERRGRQTSVYTIHLDIAAQHVHHNGTRETGEHGER